ncbi:MAG: type II toxin-antitoxin system VapC family toxin [Deltaproteobacteria bacterium]|nr:type II toxin-antitoxin system VapC family toxin [Deltaproteobacteria bacterium]
MILVDANLLLYAVIAEYRQHRPARLWLDEQLNGHPRVGLPWPSLLAFLRIVTNPRVFSDPLPMPDAWQRVASWLAVDNVWNPAAGERHAGILAELLGGPAASPKLVSDAHLAALAIEHGLVLCSTDGDFARFPTLRWENPLA